MEHGHQHQHQQPLPYTNRNAPLTADQALHALIHAQGNPTLAAERVGHTCADDLLAAIVSDEAAHDRMRVALRAFTTLRLLGTAAALQDMLLDSIESLTPQQRLQAYISTVQLAEVFTKAAPVTNNTNNTVNNNVDITNNLLRLVPPDVREALLTVMGQPPPPPTNILAGPETGLAAS